MSSLRRALLASTVLAASSAFASAAFADCQPDPPATGQAVTCTGTDTDGFSSPVATNLTVTIVSGASVTAPGNVIGLSDFNVVTNAGVVTATGAGAYAIAFDNANVVTNNGLVTAAGAGSMGLFVVGNANVVLNAGTIVATGGTGIYASGGSANTITNAGAILASGGATVGIYSSVGNAVLNTGSILASGSASIGLRLDGSNIASNSGTILASGADAAAVQVDGAGNTIVNTGRIAAMGANAFAVLLGGTGNTVTNAAGGVIFADNAQGARAFSASAGGNTVVNNGTIDGRILLGTSELNNNGLVQVTTGAVGVIHLVALAFRNGAAGTFAVRTDAAGVSDRLSALSASLNGTLRADVQPGLYANSQTYANVIAALSMGGTFASVVSTSPFFTASAAYIDGGGSDQVDLTLTRIPFGGVPGATQNQVAVGSALEPFYSPGATGNAATLFANLLGSTSLASLDALSGEVGTGVQNPSFTLGEQFFGSMLGQAQRWRAGGATAPQGSAAFRVQLAAAEPMFGVSTVQATPTGTVWPPRAVGPTWAAWASGFGLTGSRDGDGSVGSARLSYTTGGGAFGADVQLNPNLLLGAAVGAGASDFSLDGRASGGDVRTIFFGLYGSWTMGPLYVDAAVSYGHGQFSTNRTITLGSLTERATGDFTGNQYGGRIEAGWRFMVQRYALTPFIGLSVQALDQDGYRESTTNTATGTPGILGLDYAGETTTSVRSFLGGQAQTTFRLDERTTLTPRVRLAWAHEFTADRQVGASFLSIPGAAFTVNGARPARDAAIVGAGVDLGLGRTVALYAQFDGDLSGDGNAYAGSGGIRISW